MATNDTILIDGILDNIISSYNMENTPENRGKAFEDFAISELLKNYDLTHDQILDGLVDGGDDGGIDGLYFFVNGNYIADKSTISRSEEVCNLNILSHSCASRLVAKPRLHFCLRSPFQFTYLAITYQVPLSSFLNTGIYISPFPAP